MTWHKFNKSYYYFVVWISTSSLGVIVVSKSKPSFWLSTSLLTVITYYYFGVWICTSLIRIIIISKSKTSFWLGTSLIIVKSISECKLAQV